MTSSNYEYYINEELNLLRKTSRRTIELENTGIRDKCFWHSTTGVLYIYDKLVGKYKLDEFKSVRNYWLNKTIVEEKYFNSFKTFTIDSLTKNEKYIDDLGLIEGCAGIFLVLINYLNKRFNTWDNIFML